MSHPEYPLALEERVAIVTGSTDEQVVLATRAHFAKRRNAEFPDWAKNYRREVKKWTAWQADTKTT